MPAGKRSAGILLYRWRDDALQVFLIHPGGPFWVKKDAASWSIPKGEVDADENPLAAAVREFQEETGVTLHGAFLELRPVKQAGGKTVIAFALEGEIDADAIVSNSFRMEWPPRSGRVQEFPEVDRAGWFELDAAREKILGGQLPLLEELAAIKSGG